MPTIAIVIASLIIISLATYAAYLLLTLQRRTKANQQAQAQRQAKAEELKTSAR